MAKLAICFFVAVAISVGLTCSPTVIQKGTKVTYRDGSEIWTVHHRHENGLWVIQKEVPYMGNVFVLPLFAESEELTVVEE